MERKPKQTGYPEEKIGAKLVLVRAVSSRQETLKLRAGRWGGGCFIKEKSNEPLRFFGAGTLF